MTNLLMVSIDDLFSLNAWAEYRDIVQTPNLDAFGATSTEFTQAFSEVALCNPSRSATLSGQSPWETGILDNSLDLFEVVETTDILHSHLANAGYEIVQGGKVFHNIFNPAMNDFVDRFLPSDGLRVGESEGSSDIEGFSFGPSGETVLADDTLTENVVAFLQEEHPEAFALAAGLFRPHATWTVPQEYFDLYDPNDIPIPFFGDPQDEADLYYALTGEPYHQRVLENDIWVDLLHAYFASVSYADDMFGQMIDALDASPYANDTHVVVWSDHGYHLGDRGEWAKFTLWEEAARAPVWIREAGQTTGQTIDTVISLADLYPTILNLMGVESGFESSGFSLTPLLEGNADAYARDGALTWMYGGFSYRTDDFRYIRNEDGTEEFYDITNDPHQLVNLVDDPSFAAVLDDHRVNALLAQPGFQVVVDHGGDETIAGGAGNDIILSSGGNDTLIGGSGNDYYALLDDDAMVVEEFNGGIDTIIATDWLVLPTNVENGVLRRSDAPHFVQGNQLSNMLTTGPTDGTVFGMGGDDTIYTVGGTDLIGGGNGSDQIFSGAGDDSVRGAAGDDYIDADRGNDQVGGGTGNDTIYGENGIDRIFGGSGLDEIYGGNGNDLIFSGADNDSLFGGNESDLLRGGSGNDDLFGGAGEDSLFGGDGDDTLLIGPGGGFGWGGDGNDLLQASTGTTVLLNGWLGDDIIRGGRVDAITLIGGEGHDFLTMTPSSFGLVYGGSGNDRVVNFGESSTMFGGAGIDTITGSSGTDFLYGGLDTDILYARDGVESRLFGQSGHDFLFSESSDGRLFGGLGNDRLFGGVADGAQLFGGDGQDILRAGAGHVSLRGGDGEDILHAGDGRSDLFGGADADQFVINSDFVGFGFVYDYEIGLDGLLISQDLALDGETAQDALVRLATEMADRVAIDTDEGRLVIRNVTLADLTANIDFL